MSISDITALRKAGKYREALVLAWNERSYVDDPWTQMSLFWCLYDFCKFVRIPQNEIEKARKCLLEMEKLLPTMKDDNGAGKDCFLRLSNQLLPHANVIKRCNNIAKKDPEFAYKELSKVPLSEIDESLHEDYGWTLYWYLKAKVEKAGSNRDESEIKALLKVYLGLHNPRPSTLHSMIIVQVARYAESNDNFDFTGFMMACNPEALRDEDWQDKTITGSDGNKHECASLAKRCAALCFKAIKSSNDMKRIEWLKGFYVKAFHGIPSDKNGMRNYARLCLLSENISEAKGLYAKMILEAGCKYYIWREYANLTDDNETKIGLLLKALKKETNEDFIGKIHLDLAETLIKEKLFESAAKELKVMSDHYKKQGWSIPYKCSSLRQLCEGKRDSKQFQSSYYLGIAENVIYSSLPAVYGVIDYINIEKNVLHIIDTESNILFYKYETTELKVGNFVVFRIIKQANKERQSTRIVALREAEKSEALTKFKSCKALVDNVDYNRKQFYIAGSNAINGRKVRFSEMDTQPKLGDELDVVYVKYFDKKNREHFRWLDIRISETDDDYLNKMARGTSCHKKRICNI